MSGEDRIFIVFPSHRQRDNGVRLLTNQQCHYSFFRETGKGCYLATATEITALKDHRVKFTRLRGPFDDIHQSLSFNK